MSTEMPMPGTVKAAFAAMPKAVCDQLKCVRRQVFEQAKALKAGPLTETLKWNEPAYLTEESKSGSTIRLGMLKGRPAVFFNCQTNLVDGFRADFPEAFTYVGSRAVLLGDAYDPDALGICLGRALTYHRDKRAKRAAA